MIVETIKEMKDIWINLQVMWKVLKIWEIALWFTDSNLFVAKYGCLENAMCREHLVPRVTLLMFCKMFFHSLIYGIKMKFWTLLKFDSLL